MVIICRNLRHELNHPRLYHVNSSDAEVVAAGKPHPPFSPGSEVEDAVAEHMFGEKRARLAAGYGGREGEMRMGSCLLLVLLSLVDHHPGSVDVMKR